MPEAAVKDLTKAFDWFLGDRWDYDAIQKEEKSVQKFFSLQHNGPTFRGIETHTCPGYDFLKTLKDLPISRHQCCGDVEVHKGSDGRLSYARLGMGNWAVCIGKNKPRHNKITLQLMSFLINLVMTQEYQGVNVGILEEVVCQPPS